MYLKVETVNQDNTAKLLPNLMPFLPNGIGVEIIAGDGTVF